MRGEQRERMRTGMMEMTPTQHAAHIENLEVAVVETKLMSVDERTQKESHVVAST